MNNDYEAGRQQAKQHKQAWAYGRTVSASTMLRRHSPDWHKGYSDEMDIPFSRAPVWIMTAICLVTITIGIVALVIF